MPEQNTTKTLVITCEEGIDISSAAELYRHLAAALAEGQVVEIEASSVVRTDTAVLQIFYGFFKEAVAKGLSVRWRGASDAMRHAAALLGMSDMLRFRT